VDLDDSDGTEATGGSDGVGNTGGSEGEEASGGGADSEAGEGAGGDDATGGDSGDDATGGDGGDDATGGDSGDDATGGSTGSAGAAGSTGDDSGGCTPGGTATCDPSFGPSDACGGDERGTWNVAQACTDGGLLDQIEAQCEGSTATDNSEASGTLVLDGTTFTRDVTINVSVELSIPEGNECLGSGLIGCGTLGATLGALISDLSAACTDDGSNGCTCTFEGTSQAENTGTYTVDRAAGQLVIDPSGDAITYDYCIEEGILTARETVGQGFEDQVVQVYACQ
jgi:hypothetical protein